ncbi:transporter substrate-binding domain-containing protein [Psychrobium sp. MM17-31]|uniref:substrate-binding periplasmic protein n=1 Tax=Psychrobium sp. MM17-31 TaxID=2917758 RepID=UPI001EF6C6C3|nr:transporter substrate-binding domain-containing protein [Psychrobium sp. MM17-31]
MIKKALLLLFILILSMRCYAKQPLLVVTENLWPFNFVERGEVKGPHTELVKEILELADIDYTIAVLPWARSYQLAQTKPNVLIYTINRTNSREDKFHWIARFPSRADINYYALKSSNLTNLPSDKLKQLTIGTQIGTANDTFVTHHGFENISRVTHVRQTLGMLKIGRVDLVIASDLQLQRAAIDIGLDVNSIEKIGYAFSSIPSIAVSLQTPPEIIAKIEGAYKKLAQEKDLCQLMQYDDNSCYQGMSKAQP